MNTEQEDLNPAVLDGQQQLVYFPAEPDCNIMGAPLPHFMPTPAPNWSMDSMPWKMKTSEHGDGVMQFSGHIPHNEYDLRRVSLHQKRKSEIIVPEVPTKQFISEEKITAHFNGLHISSDYIQHNAAQEMNTAIPNTGKCFTNLTYADYKVTAKELEEKLRRANRITLCDELKQIQDQYRRTSYIPEALLNRSEGPCTALVLWQPPPVLRLLEDAPTGQKNVLNEQTKSTDVEIGVDNDNDNDNNNLVDDMLDNNNANNVDFNYAKVDKMDEDL